MDLKTKKCSNPLNAYFLSTQVQREKKRPEYTPLPCVNASSHLHETEGASGGEKLSQLDHHFLNIIFYNLVHHPPKSHGASAYRGHSEWRLTFTHTHLSLSLYIHTLFPLILSLFKLSLIHTHFLSYSDDVANKALYMLWSMLLAVSTCIPLGLRSVLLNDEQLASTLFKLHLYFQFFSWQDFEFVFSSLVVLSLTTTVFKLKNVKANAI